MNDKIMQTLRTKCEVHRMPKGIQPVHKAYGLWILHTGNFPAPAGGYYRTTPRYFEYYSISYLIEGDGKFWYPPDHELAVKPGQGIIISPGFVNRYGGDRDKYFEDSICFAGPVADLLYRSGVIRDGIYEMGQGRRLRPIMKLAADPAVDSQLNANFALQRLLFDIYNENKARGRKDSPLVDKLIETMKQQIHRWWTVEEMADFCGLSDDQFRRIFEKQTGMLPKIYLDRLKLQKAAEMLTGSELSVAAVAAELGYVDQYHFSRRFKSIMGFPPNRYRKEIGSLGNK
ncbi:MAG: AraC family transcriptional regulator [Victivallaceae bacterium]